MARLTFQRLSGAALHRYIPELAQLRMRVFRDFPYLYDGDPEYEARYLQTYVEAPHSVIVLAFDGDRVVGAVYRRADSWRTNVARGATTTSCELNDELVAVALAAARAVGAEIAGVDIVEDSDGRLLVLEVNSGVEFAGLQRALGDRCDVPGAITDLVLRHVTAGAHR